MAIQRTEGHRVSSVVTFSKENMENRVMFILIPPFFIRLRSWIAVLILVVNRKEDGEKKNRIKHYINNRTLLGYSLSTTE